MPKSIENNEYEIPQPEGDRQKVKEDIKTALAKGDLTSLMRAGIESFMNVLCRNDSPRISFQRFLDHTGALFDHYVLDTSRQEHLNYVGGKMILQLGHGKRKGDDAIPIYLSADLYFQTTDKKWIVKKKQGQVDSTRFTDWDTDETAIELQRTGKLELSIDPPNT